ncbi:MAG TPA: cysteine--tRNA ligase [Alphaproteobacteria bacterium]|nr:MAG: Cysteine--tRNA ligase [Alphaproteobacteria bacterium MarineAlpha9_Bin6]HIA20897.1 cysteine--tRNA ligase [Alphaproteobacteria bacterium]HIB55692.1 cysteine--tRNA ligase [Alphaproteobacteria bacterium]
MMLHLYNTLNRKKVEFVPLDEEHVRVYVCGPTVYDHIHVGNARPIIVFDVLYRLLQHLYPRVTYVRNITDIDDKIIVRAAERGEEIGALTERTIRQFHHDIEALGTLKPDIEPRATDHIHDMIKMINLLLIQGFAYSAEQHVLFHVPALQDYGRLSRRDRDDMVAGARVEVAPYKKDPADFVLWKPSMDDQVGWNSPWGRGRPGWHIECSAMSTKYLGPDFDIHGGGEDLIFPHHENEIAQSQCAHPDSSFAQWWLHNGYLRSEGKKMSKSLGNFYTVKELLGAGEREKMWRGESIRLMMLSTHYRQPLDFTKSGVDNAKKKLDRWYRALGDVDFEDGLSTTGIVEALCDDLNTPRAVAIMDALCGSVSVGRDGVLDAKRDLRAGASLLGLLQYSSESWFQGGSVSESREGGGDIESLIAQRLVARGDRDFDTADSIRQSLLDRGVVLEDKPDGTTVWRRIS